MTGDAADRPRTALESLAARAAAGMPSPAARAIARMSLLDTAACIHAGWGSPQHRAVAAMLARTGGGGMGARALETGTAAHALDFDDYEELGSTHPSAVIVPALIAAGAGTPCTLGAVETAYVAGYQTILALGAALGYGHYEAGWHATSTLAGIGTAAAVARLLRLDAARTAAALSLAISQAAGLKAQFGTDAKALHAGLAARAGLEAAMLAAGGMGAATTAADGETGFTALYGTPVSPGWQAVERAGWPVIDANPPFRKAAPACGYTLRAIDAALEIATRPGFAAAAVTAVRIDIAAPYLTVAGFTAPETPHRARFSLTWCVAAALIDGAVGPDHFTDAALTRADLRAMEARITPVPYALGPELGDISAQAPDRVTVQRAGGTELTAACAVPRGGPGRGFSREDLLAKLELCGLDRADGDAFLDLPGDAPFGDSQPMNRLMAPGRSPEQETADG